MMAPFAIAGFFVLVVACGVGFGAASADSSDDLARVGAFGFDEATNAATQRVSSSDIAAPEGDYLLDHQTLADTSPRDIGAGLAMIEEQKAQRQHAPADSAAADGRAEAGQAKQGQAVQTVAFVDDDDDDGILPITEVLDYDLPTVDWSCGKEAFLAEWTSRIDAYLSGTNLEGYGRVFAEAAWENGVDPRWSPAISNTESGNGSVCFLPYNAWGWGDSVWSDWETAIRAHVLGLSEVYGYSITLDAARTYCPPNYVHWYSNTLGQMALI